MWHWDGYATLQMKVQYHVDLYKSNMRLALVFFSHFLIRISSSHMNLSILFTTPYFLWWNWRQNMERFFMWWALLSLPLIHLGLDFFSDTSSVGIWRDSFSNRHFIGGGSGGGGSGGVCVIAVILSLCVFLLWKFLNNSHVPSSHFLKFHLFICLFALLHFSCFWMTTFMWHQDNQFFLWND